MAMDVLWKSPWGLTARGTGFASGGGNTEAAWMDQYGGGWQEIFPNGGDECAYKNAPLNFHGEASIQAWDYTVQKHASSCFAVEHTVALRRSPFRIHRTVIVERNLAGLQNSRVDCQQSEENLHYLWGHHPALGDPFLSGDCVLRVPARTFVSHSLEISASTQIPAGVRGPWPLVEGEDDRPVDLSRIPLSSDHVAEFGYICDLEDSGYGITSSKHSFRLWLGLATRGFPLFVVLAGTARQPWISLVRALPHDGRRAFQQHSRYGSDQCHRRRDCAPVRAGAKVEANLAAVFYEAEQGDLRSSAPAALRSSKVPMLPPANIWSLRIRWPKMRGRRMARLRPL